MVIGVPKELDLKKMDKEVEDFSKTYSLEEDEKKELAFIIRSFVKYYNNLSKSKHTYSHEEIIDSFNGVLETITETYNGTGTRTRADLFWQQVPSVFNMLTGMKNNKDSSKEKEEDTDYKKSSSKLSSSKSSGYTSYDSGYSGGCGGSSSYYHSSYSYGGCGGGGGYSGGGHC